MAPHLARDLVTKEGEGFELLMELCRTLIDQGREDEAATLLSRTRELVEKPRGKTQPRVLRDRIELLLCDAASVMRHHEAAVGLARGLCAKWPYSLAAWSRYCSLSPKAGLVRSWASNIPGLRRRHPDSLPLAIMQGHVHSLMKQYPEAMVEYIQALGSSPREPLLLLCAGINLINLAGTRRVPDRNKAVLQAFAFLQDYSRHRVASALRLVAQSAEGRGSPLLTPAPASSRRGGETPRVQVGAPPPPPGGPLLDRSVGFSNESWYMDDAVACCSREAGYNLGRAAHQLGLLHIARRYYLHVLGGDNLEASKGVEGKKSNTEGQAAAQDEAAVAPPSDPHADCMEGVVEDPAADAGADADVLERGRREASHWVGSGSVPSPSPPPPPSAGPSSPSSSWKCEPLSLEAAHNLAMMYMGCGAREQAREVYRRHMIII